MSINIDNQTAQAFALEVLASDLYHASIHMNYELVDAIVGVINQHPYVLPEQVAQQIIVLQGECLTEAEIASCLEYRAVATTEHRAKLFTQLVELVRLSGLTHKLASKLTWYKKSCSWDANGGLSDEDVLANHKLAWRRLQSFIGGTLGSFLGKHQTSTPNAPTLLQALSTRLHS